MKRGNVKEKFFKRAKFKRMTLEENDIKKGRH